MTRREALEIVLSLANAYLDSDKMNEYSLPKHGQAIDIVETMRDSVEEEIRDPFDNGHIRCSTCGECITCNLGPCRDGGHHIRSFYSQKKGGIKP